jgi:Family of unknown function (DUF5906)
MSNEDDEYPTKDEVKANRKEAESATFGDNVVKLPEKVDTHTSSEDSIIKQVDKYYADAIMGNKYVIINERRPDKIIFMSKKDFIDSMASEKMLITSTTPKGEPTSKFEPVSKYWLEHKHRSYGFVIFDPSRPFHRDDPDYNQWPGFPVIPKKGSCYKFLKYVKIVLCGGNKDHYRWLMAWCAHIFQYPADKPETSVVIQGEEQGSGKSFFPVVLSKLLPDKSYFSTANPKLITGDFSGHLEQVLLLHAEEAFSAESNREDSIIKNIISENRLGINAKGVEAKFGKSYIRMIMTGNPAHIVKADRFARRFLVLKISSKYTQNTQYYGELARSLNNGGYAALMYYFMHYPIDKFDLRIVLKTNELLNQKLLGLKGEERFWYTYLYEGEISILGTTHSKYYYELKSTEYIVIKYKLFSQFQRFMNRKIEKNRSDSVSFGMIFAKFFPMLDDKGNIVRDKSDAPVKYLKSDKQADANCYIIPQLTTCRRMFDAYLGQKCDWPDNTEWTEKEYDS